MLKHIVEIKAHNQHEVEIRHKITDGHKTAQAMMTANSCMGAYSVRVGKHHPYSPTPQFIVRITNMEHHEHILKDLKKKAMSEFHADIHTEFRMNEG